MNKHIYASQRYKSQISANVMISRVHLDFGLFEPFSSNSRTRHIPFLTVVRSSFIDLVHID